MIVAPSCVARAARVSSRRRLAALGATVVLFAMLVARAGAAGPDVRAMSRFDPAVEGTTAGGDLAAGRGAVSADGRYVVFVSSAANLAAGYSGSGAQVWLFDAVAGAHTLVSHAAGAAMSGGSCASSAPRIDGDGDFVVFQSCASNLVAGYAGAGEQVYLFARGTGAVTLVSHASGSATSAGNGEALYPRISADGAWVTYVSLASDLVAGFTGGPTYNAFAWERASGATTLISHAAGDPVASASCSTSATAPDATGSWVAFQSCAGNLAGGSGLVAAAPQSPAG